MEKIKALWARFAGADWALVPFLRVMWGYLCAGVEKVRASIVAFVSSPAVWLAGITFFLGGFWLGHIEGAHGKRALRAEIAAYQRAATVTNDRIVTLQAGNRTAVVEIKRLKGELEAAKAEKARSAAISAPVAAKPARRVVRTRKPQSAAVAAPAKPWWPFQ